MVRIIVKIVYLQDNSGVVTVRNLVAESKIIVCTSSISSYGRGNRTIS